MMDTTLMEFTGEDTGWDGPFRIVDCSRALSPSGLPEMDYALNPYGGCEHGCIYCYAPGHTHSDLSTWRVVRVKRNVVERLSKELPYVEGTIGLGTVTDPYQGAERRFRLTRRSLEVLRAKDRRIHIHTKSDLVTRDIDILRDMDAIVGMTVTTVDDRISKMTEPGAPLPSVRLGALSEMIDAGIDSYVLIAPVMSTLRGHELELIDALKETGVRMVLHEPLNLRLVDPDRLNRMGITSSADADSALSRLCLQHGLDDF